MSAAEAFIVAVSGFAVVFLMLLLLWAIIEVVNKVVTSVENKNKAAEKGVAEAVVTPEPVVEIKTEEQPHQIYGGEIALYNVDEKTAACIMAIVSDQTDIPLNQLIFKSIRACE